MRSTFSKVATETTVTLFRGHFFLFGFPALLLTGLGVSAWTYLTPNNSSVVSTSVPEPGLYFDRTTVDFGSVETGTTVQTNFTVTNRYPEAVEIKKVVGGCSCQSASISQNRLEPGETATISAEWKIGQVRHRIAESVWVTHTLPAASPEKMGELGLILQAEAVPEIDYDPEQLEFVAGRDVDIEVRLKPGTRVNFAIKRVGCAAPYIQTSISGDNRVVRVHFDSKLLPKLRDVVKDALVIETDSPIQPRLTVPVRVVPQSP